jgi:uncharacterized protein (DUF1697 family)
MALVVFMRAVNVGGYQKFQPAALAKKLADLNVVNIGAAGTFVVRERIAEKALRKKMLAEMGFEPAMMVVSADDVIELVKSKPFGKKLARNAKGFVSIIEKPLREPPDLPVDQPKGHWGVRVIALQGRFAMSLWRRLEGKTMVYPNAVVEKKFGVAATTRNWNTMEAVVAILSNAAIGQ